ncbi:MAG TPA: hypothetical protein PK036_04515 [Geobacteraceae bacterium]|nr:hypothetical protein [Geobacteraceae bacterium]
MTNLWNPPALKASGVKTKEEAIEKGLKLPVQLKGDGGIKGSREGLQWTGNLDEMRNDWWQL